jgi:hypothetical protein
VTAIPGMALAHGAGDTAGATFEWPELAEAEADLELRGVVSTYLGRPESDADQVRA